MAPASHAVPNTDDGRLEAWMGVPTGHQVSAHRELLVSTQAHLIMHFRLPRQPGQECETEHPP